MFHFESNFLHYEMESVSVSNKTILREDGRSSFTIEMIDGKIVLQEYIKVMRLGNVSAKWLFDCLDAAKNHYLQEQILEHNGKKVLTVLGEVKYFFIIGTNVRFVMTREVAEKLFSWLVAFLPHS
jgi:hypothetical protein